MKILQVHTRYREAGGEDYVADAEAELLRGAGHHVLRYVTQNPPGAPGAAASLAASPWNAAAASRVKGMVEAHAPDVVHVHNTWYALSPAVLSAIRKAGAPVVLTLHNFRLLCSNALLFRDGGPCQDCVGTHPWHGVRHRCYRNSTLASTAAALTIATHQKRGTWTRDVDAFLALTEFARDRFIEGGLPPEKIRVKPNFTADPGPRTVSPTDSDVVLFVGRLSREKGIIELLRAWNEADPQPLRLLIVGDGPLRRQAQEMVGPRTEILGFRQPDEIRQLMLSARTLVFPSRWYEMFALTIVEAMAAGLPVVANDLGGIPQVLGAGAPVISRDTHEDWVAALKEIVTDSGLEEAGRRGRERFEQHFSAHRAVEQLESVYSFTIAEARG